LTNLENLYLNKGIQFSKNTKKREHDILREFRTLMKGGVYEKK
jgi:hypothetical protein